MKVSILMLTHNAPQYVKESIETVRSKTEGISYELIVVDNASGLRTRNLLKKFYREGAIDKLLMSKQNLLFAKGNNVASGLCSADSDYILLLNSDVRINNPYWLRNLLSVHPKEGGISAYGLVTNEPIRADGFCLLIDRSIYDRYKLDDSYAWFWGVTKLESIVLRQGMKVISVKDYENMLHHYGGKSGRAFRHAAGMNTDIEQIRNWFGENTIDIIDSIK
ncbi:glycosyltransferase family 2 protein [Candidatus Allofournierella merdipullorum]|uniref:glycosyltransferase family 2 protein n=1 Tax=Candidatus Allofournierella merdipullorum TaxID=2838595 RepID=UPI003AB22F3D